jgi:hypothetical protein
MSSILRRILAIAAGLVVLSPGVSRADDVPVRMQTPNTTLLDADRHVVICESPCEVRVPRDGRYVVRERGAANSHAFTLTPSAERVDLDVHAESHSLAVVGGVVMAGALAIATAFAVGAAVVEEQSKTLPESVSPSSCAGWFSSCSASHPAADARTEAVALGVAGGGFAVAGLITGVSLMLMHATRTVVQSDGIVHAPRRRALQWTPTLQANAHGASAGVTLAF